MYLTAPTLDAEEDAKDSFYDDLQNVNGSVSAGDIPMVAGDWNA